MIFSIDAKDTLPFKETIKVSALTDSEISESTSLISKGRTHMMTTSTLDARSELLNRRIDADLLDKLCLGWELQPTEIQTIMSSDSLAAWVLLFRSRKTSIERIVDASRKMPLSQREIVKCRILNECERRGYGSVLEYEKFRLEAFVSGELVGVELSETDRSETAKPL